jgi:hypothetical protein
MLKLSPLPDRTLQKLVLHIEPALMQRLTHYAEAYTATYERTEPVPTLINGMIETFLNGDTAFRRLENRRHATVRKPAHRCHPEIDAQIPSDGTP